MIIVVCLHPHTSPCSPLPEQARSVLFSKKPIACWIPSKFLMYKVLHCSSHLPFSRLLFQLFIQNKQIYLVELWTCLLWAQHWHLAQHSLVWNAPSLSTSFQPASLPTKNPVWPVSNVSSFTNLDLTGPARMSNFCSFSTESHRYLLFLDSKLLNKNSRFFYSA